MLDVLDRLEAELPALLADEAGWNSLDINYHPPRVELAPGKLPLTTVAWIVERFVANHEPPLLG